MREQRDSILRYCSRNGFEIVSWFEEQETAAKRGRPVFNRMLKLLSKGQAGGVVLHKIDRGARNLKDWADLAELIDAGVQVHFANESLDMHSRGGRLSADIQAVVAADFVRNLREETRKGFYGRLKQGIYPRGAPLGYVNNGGGKPKTIDPVKGALVRKAFQLYSTGRYNLDTLGAELHRLGLRNIRGGRVTRTGLSTLLNNPFYTGLIRVKRTGEMFPGIHEPLVRKSVFDRVQLVLKGKFNARSQQHVFLFRRLLTCATCGYSLIGETQKGHVYYRCHSAACSGTSVREEIAETAVSNLVQRIRFDDDEKAYFRPKVIELRKTWATQKEEEIKSAKLQLDSIKNRLNRLTDAYLDGTLDKAMFEQRKAALLMDQKTAEENLSKLTEDVIPYDKLEKFLELAGNAWLSHTLGLPEERRDLVKILTSNRIVSGKNVELKPSIPFREVTNRFENTSTTPHRDIPRTWDRLLGVLLKLIIAGQVPELATAIYRTPGEAGCASGARQ